MFHPRLKRVNTRLQISIYQWLMSFRRFTSSHWILTFALFRLKNDAKADYRAKNVFFTSIGLSEQQTGAVLCTKGGKTHESFMVIMSCLYTESHEAALLKQRGHPPAWRLPDLQPEGEHDGVWSVRRSAMDRYIPSVYDPQNCRLHRYHGKDWIA